MNIDGWRADTLSFAALLPPETEVAHRVQYLLSHVIPRFVEVHADVFNRPVTNHTLPDDRILVVDKEELKSSPTVIGRMARYVPGLAFVAHSSSISSALALPKYDGTTPLGNAEIILHELEHLTEKENGLFIPDLIEPFRTADSGKRERRAYKLNTDILAAVDGSDFVQYVAKWPIVLTTTERDGDLHADLSFEDIECPVPNKETLAYDLWQEGGMSRLLLQSIGRAGAFENVAADLPPHMANHLVGNRQPEV